MDSIISVQDIRMSLGDIARRAESGESFTVVRNSKPSFRIIPVGVAASEVREASPTYATKRTAKVASLAKIREAFKATAQIPAITAKEIKVMIAEVRREKRGQAPSASK